MSRVARAKESLGVLLRDPAGAVGLAIVVLISLLALFAPWIAPFGFDEQHGDALLQRPSAEWLLGTDRLGRDQLSRLLFGARISIAVAVATSLVAVIVGTAWGAVAGWRGGRTDAVLMRVVDGLYAFPDLLVVVLIATVVGQSPAALVVALSMLSWVGVARVVRGEVLALRERTFVEAARALGSTPWRIVTREILPNVIAPILITLTFRIPAVIVSESTLSFLGLGLQPPASSWGVLAAEGWSAMAFYPHLIVWPAAAIFVTVLGFNLLADALRRINGD
jgi:oligopeptide transport system permease protein